MLVGHGTIRNKVLGNTNKKPTSEELNLMKELIDQEMNAGAFGMSTGLFYSPGSYSNTEEIISLAQVVSKNGGIYDTHLRDESNYNIGLISSVNETIEIGLKANIPVHISHIKCLGRDVWHQSDSIIKLIEFYRNKGLSITANQYPYDASATSLKGAVVPRWAESGGKDSLFIRFNNNKLKLRILSETSSNIFRRGGADKLLIVNSKNSDFIGKNLLELSEIFTKSPEETVYELIESENIQVASFNMIEEDIINFMKQSWVFTGSDGNTGHPRKYGSFPKKYSEYVVNKKVLNLSEFISNSTSKPAEFFNVNKRGKIKEGYYADIIIFDPLYFKDKADYSNAFVYSEGLIYSIINGELIIDKNNFTGQLKGKVLKK
jgi:N-acyl-D-aspartate/D-glutamate deacylase